LKIEVVPTARDLQPENLTGKTALVIDVLRATSTIITALNNGCQAVFPVTTPEEALELRRRLSGPILLGGERQGRRIEGFDLGNSPAEYPPEVVAGKKIIFTTTNGTRAIRACTRAANLVIASFLNAAAVVEFAAGTGTNILVVCAGTRGHFSLDDILCAGLVVDRLLQRLRPAGLDPTVDDLGLAAVDLYHLYSNDIRAGVERSLHARRLKQMGFDEDIALCTRVDCHPLVAIYHEGSVVPHSSGSTKGPTSGG